jgi:hypothetical protein
MAKFEVCCHKFADLSEHNYGVSIINSSKYGFATSGNLMRLSLLRSPKAPDANADMGAYPTIQIAPSAIMLTAIERSPSHPLRAASASRTPLPNDRPVSNQLQQPNKTALLHGETPEDY